MQRICTKYPGVGIALFDFQTSGFADEFDLVAVATPGKVADAHFIQAVVVLAVIKHDLVCLILRSVGIASNCFPGKALTAEKVCFGNIAILPQNFESLPQPRSNSTWNPCDSSLFHSPFVTCFHVFLLRMRHIVL